MRSSNEARCSPITCDLWIATYLGTIASVWPCRELTKVQRKGSRLWEGS